MNSRIPPLIDATDPVLANALSHPTRHRLLLALGNQGATVSQLLNRLIINKGNAVHLDELIQHLEPAPEREQRYGVIVGVYRHQDVRRPQTAP